MQFGPYHVDIKNRDKPFFPGSEITKGDLIDYYGRIAGCLLPYLEDRPLTLSRFPDGIEEEGFYQKEKPDYFPDWIETVEVEKEDGTNHQVICNNKATLIYLVNQGTLSLHPWLSTSAHLHKPDRIVFDLDPPQGNFDIVLEGAKALRGLLEEKLDMAAFVMTTGSKGMHVVSPIKPADDFNEVRAFAQQASRYLALQRPDDFTTEVRKNKRNGRLFFDYLRNAYAQTSIPPYSVRAIEGAPIATPLAWDELSKMGLTSRSYHIKNIFRRLNQIDDPWKNHRRKAVRLQKNRDALDRLIDRQ